MTPLEIIKILVIVALASIALRLLIQAMGKNHFLFVPYPPTGTYAVIEMEGVFQYVVDGDNPPTDLGQAILYQYTGTHFVGITRKIAYFKWYQQTIDHSHENQPEGITERQEYEICYIPRHFVYGADIPAVDTWGFPLRLLLEVTLEIPHGQELEFCKYIRTISNWLTALVGSPLISTTKYYMRDQSIQDVRAADTKDPNENFQKTYTTSMATSLTCVHMHEILLLDFVDENAKETNAALQQKEKAKLAADALIEEEKGKTAAKEEQLKQAETEKKIKTLDVDVKADYVKRVIEPTAAAGAVDVLAKEQIAQMSNLQVLVIGDTKTAVNIPTPPLNQQNQGGGNV